MELVRLGIGRCSDGDTRINSNCSQLIHTPILHNLVDNDSGLQDTHILVSDI